MEKAAVWWLVVALAILVQPSRGALAQISEQNYALAFETVVTTLRRCGVELGYAKIEAACATLNHYNALFRKLAFVVFCCVKKQLWPDYEPCQGLDYEVEEDDVDRWERKVRGVELEDFAKSQVSLMSFCLHFVRSNQENIQFGIIKKLEEAVNKVQVDISSSSSFVARFEQKRNEVNIALQRIKDQTAETESKVKQFKRNQKKTRQTLKKVTKIIKNQHIHGEIKKFRVVDFFLGSQIYAVFLCFYLFMQFFVKNIVFEQHKRQLYTVLLIVFAASLVLDSRNFSLGIDWAGINSHKTKLVLKAVLFVYFLYSIRTTIGHKRELQRRRLLQEFEADCQRIQGMRYRRY